MKDQTCLAEVRLGRILQGIFEKVVMDLEIPFFPVMIDVKRLSGWNPFDPPFGEVKRRSHENDFRDLGMGCSIQCSQITSHAGADEAGGISFEGVPHDGELSGDGEVFKITAIEGGNFERNAQGGESVEESLCFA